MFQCLPRRVQERLTFIDNIASRNPRMETIMIGQLALSSQEYISWITFLECIAKESVDFVLLCNQYSNMSYDVFILKNSTFLFTS